MADRFVKPPFFQWGVRPVASRGLGEPAAEGFYLRGWEASRNDTLNDNERVLASCGWFTYRVPDTYVAGTNIVMHVDGGLLPDAPGNPFPQPIAGSVRCAMLIVDGLAGIPDQTPYSSTGFSWAPGGEWHSWGSQSSGTWTNEGPGGIITGTIDPDRLNEVYTLIDGAPALPDEGCLIALPSGNRQPYGFSPVIRSTLAFVTESPLPGQTVGFQLFTQVLSLDAVNLDAAAFLYINSITMEAAGEFTPIDLRSITVGFGPNGSTGLPWPFPSPSGVFYTAPWNPYRLIENFRPPITCAVEPDRGYQDVWLVGTVPPVEEGVRITSEAENRITADGAVRVYV